MIAKELRDGWWKFAVATLLVLVVVLAFPVPAQYEEIVKAYDPPSTSPLEVAIREMFALYTAGGFFVLVPLAALLGGTLVSSEVSGNTIYLLFSRPMSRWRLLLVKYAVCAAILFVAAVSGSVLLVLVASSKGYPLDSPEHDRAGVLCRVDVAGIPFCSGYWPIYFGPSAERSWKRISYYNSSVCSLCAPVDPDRVFIVC